MPVEGWVDVHWIDNLNNKYKDSIPKSMLSNFTNNPNISIKKIVG